jgi:hypothetical protein
LVDPEKPLKASIQAGSRGFSGATNLRELGGGGKLKLQFLSKNIIIKMHIIK